MNLLNIISNENCVIPNIGYSRSASGILRSCIVFRVSRYIFQEQSARISWTYSTIRATCRCSRIVENPAQIARTVCVCVCVVYGWWTVSGRVRIPEINWSLNKRNYLVSTYVKTVIFSERLPPHLSSVKLLHSLSPPLTLSPLVLYSHALHTWFVVFGCHSSIGSNYLNNGD